jgi:hypothetical protein
MTFGERACGARAHGGRDERNDGSCPGRHDIDCQCQRAALTLIAGELAAIVLIGRFRHVFVHRTGVRGCMGHSRGGDLQAERQLKRNEREKDVSENTHVLRVPKFSRGVSAGVASVGSSRHLPRPRWAARAKASIPP